MKTITGITDLTTTEGNLRNFSRICKLVYSQGSVNRKQLTELIKNYDLIRRKNEKVIGRHIRILEKLGILEKRNGSFLLSSEGEVLYEIVKNIEDRDETLRLHEKIFYFREFFTKGTFAQLSLLLKILQESEGKPKDEVVADYFKLILKSRIKLWRKSSLKRRLEKYEKYGILQRPEENRFDCMRMWLQQLGLVKKLILTPVGKHVLSKIDPNNMLLFNIPACHSKTQENIYEIASLLVEKKRHFAKFNFDDQKQRKIFMKLFKDAYFKFEKPMLGLANMNAVVTEISLNLLTEYGIILEEKEFNVLLDKLFKKRIIESIVPGDYGETTYIKVKANNL